MSETNQENKRENENSGIKFHATSVLICPDCNETVRVGFGGKKNLAIHRTSKACQKKQSSKSKGPKRAPEKPPKANQPNHDLRAFFKPRVPLNPPTVVAPPLIHTNERSFSELSDNQEAMLETYKHNDNDTLAETRQALKTGAPLQAEARKVPCQKGVELLSKLEAAATRIPNDVPLATPAHQLSLFSADPRSCVISIEQGMEVEVEDDWAILNSMLKTAFGWGELEMRENVKEMINRGEYGLDGFIQFFKFFVFHRGLEGAMIEPKIEGLLHEIDTRYAPPGIPQFTCQTTAMSVAACEATTSLPVTTCETVPKPMPITTSGAEQKTKKVLRAEGSLEGRREVRCEGIFVEFPHGKNHHISYPFGLHSERNVPWDYRSTKDKFYIQAKLCRKPSISQGSACEDCQALTSIPLYISNAPLVYHGVGGLVEVARCKTGQVRQLRLTKLNASRKLLGKATALDDHKQWIMAIASGRVDRVASLVQAGLKHRTGIKTLIQQYECAAEKLYQPKGYSNEDLMRSIVMLRLGGAPVSEIEENIISCHSGLAGIGDNLDSGACSGRLVHQVIMLDELAIEQRVRWDDLTNKFLGICREHGHNIPLEFTSERELDILCDAINDNRVHLACEATVAGIGALSELPREYAVHPIMFSGTCKRETGLHHARVIQSILNAVGNTNVRKDHVYRTVCIASDGEAKHGDVLVILTMNFQLSASSPIYGQLFSLKLMNYLVGPDDLTADKDFKHVFKRQRNLLMRQKGILVQGFCVTPAILRTHLESHGVPPHRLRSLLNPNDKQDVVLAYSLLKEIWSLPPPPADSSPSFACAREALNVYGQFAHHLMMPYVCVDLDLDQQLIHLSAAAHMAFFLYRDCSARTQFMPMQSYVDIMIMIKNVFYCVAKAKVDNPHGKFYPILLGTDRLETFFGLIWTAVGTDTNVDVLQLGSWASGLTEVALILAEHLEWDLGTRCLALPCITRDAQAGEITSRFDHISPKDWRGDPSVARVNLHSCWFLGSQEAIACIPDAGHVFEQLWAECDPNIDILSPLGTLLVNQRNQEHDSEDDDFAPVVTPEGPAYTPSDTVQGVNNVQTALPYTHDGDLEDAIAEEMPRNNVDSAITVEGRKTSKAKALRYRMAYRSARSSTDRLRRVQNIPCFGPTASTSESDPWPGSTTTGDTETVGPSLRIGNPVAILVRCDALVVLAVAQVNRLQFASQTNLDELAVHLLADPTAKVDCQILRLVPATIEDDLTRVHDWCWSMRMEATCESIDGRHVHALNPTVSVLSPGKPTFLFEGSFLVTLSCSLFQDLQPQDYRSLPVVRRTEFFPYRFEGLACFVCDEKLSNSMDINSQGCPRLGCGSIVNWKNGQRVLEHMGAHILHDNLFEEGPRNCWKRLGGPQEVKMRKYDDFPITVCLSQSEKDGMRKVWNSRDKAQRYRKIRPKNKPSLAISEAHRARLYLHSDAGNQDNQEEGPAPPSSPTWYPYASLSPRPTPAPSTAHQTAHLRLDLRGLNAPNESTTSTFESTITTPSPESPMRAQVQALESNMRPSTQPSDTIAQPSELTALQGTLPAIPTLVPGPLSPHPGPPSLSPICALPELPVSTRGRRLRKANVLSLNMCTCGVTITDSEIGAGVNVMKCRVPGCETVWFHQTCMDYEFSPKNWACDSCTGSTSRRRQV
ncbi:hypothetical protein H4582DRAFT_2060981 [Lactarius indigo]|nr:hypothetical protein H4582DRAFT_2060981 [Lactarius indigo]